MTAALLVFAFLLPPGSDANADLEGVVREYWDSLETGNRQQALWFVTQESLENFARRQEPPFRNWRLLEMTTLSDSEARVVVSVERYIQGGLYALRITETWEKTREGWKVRIVDPVETRRALWMGPGPQPRKGKLEVLPTSLKVHLLGKNQVDNLKVFNGLNADVEIVSFRFDQERFEWVNPVAGIPAGQVGTLALRYKGEAREADLASEAVLVLRHGSEETRVLVPITYNYVSPGARSLFGLSEAAAAAGGDAPLPPRGMVPHPDN